MMIERNRDSAAPRQIDERTQHGDYLRIARGIRGLRPFHPDGQFQHRTGWQMGDDLIHRMPSFERFLAEIELGEIGDHRKPAVTRGLFPSEKHIPSLLRLAVHRMIGGAVAEALEQCRLCNRIVGHR